jgi:hypothetical protein
MMRGDEKNMGNPTALAACTCTPLVHDALLRAVKRRRHPCAALPSAACCFEEFGMVLLEIYDHGMYMTLNWSVQDSVAWCQVG